MIFSKTSEYAIRALHYLAKVGPGRSVGVGEVSRKTHVPAAYVAKIFQGLAQAAILVSQRGPKGGYGFRKNPQEVSIYEVVDATDNIKGSPLAGCVMGLKMCSEHNPCALHTAWAKSRERIIKTMKVTPIADAFESTLRKSFVGPRPGVLSKKIRAVLRPKSF